MRFEATPIEPPPEVAAQARQQIMDALATLYPGWDFTGGVGVALTAHGQGALYAVGDAYDNAPVITAALRFAGDLGQALAF